MAFHHVFLWQSIGCLKINVIYLYYLCSSWVRVCLSLLISIFAAHSQHIRSTLTQMACLTTVCISMRLRCWYSINKVTFLPIEIRLEMWGIAMITSCLAATTSGSRGQWVGRLDKARQTFLHRNGRHGDWPHHSARMASAGLEWAAWRVWKKIETNCDENSPSFLLVLTAAGGAYKREDGVYVAPINLLKP